MDGDVEQVGRAKNRPRDLWVVVGVLAAFAAFAIGFSLWLVGGSSVGTAGNSREAVAQCEGFSDKRLKAPATADYNLTATEANRSWSVIGTVDSENGFGANVRSDVACVIHFADGLAVLDSIAIG